MGSISTVPASPPLVQGDGEFPSSASVSLYGESQRQPVAATKSSEVEMSSLSVSPRVPRIFLLLLLLAKSSLQAEGSSCNLTLTPDPRSQNVVSTQLEGSWVIDDELTERLWPNRPDFVWKSSNVTFKFENSSEVLDMIPEEDCKFFHNAATERPIYMAGYFSDRENEEPWTTYPMVTFETGGSSA